MLNLYPYKDLLNDKQIAINKTCDWCNVPITYEEIDLLDCTSYKDASFVIGDKLICSDCFNLLKRRSILLIKKMYFNINVDFRFSYDTENTVITLRITFNSFYNIFLTVKKTDDFIDICNSINELMNIYEIGFNKKIMSLYEFRKYVFDECKNIFRCTLINNTFVYGI
jgi:hypothetical protein